MLTVLTNCYVNNDIWKNILSENEQIDPEVNMNAIELIEYNGFQPQIHHITTNDGYILGPIPYLTHYTLV